METILHQLKIAVTGFKFLRTSIFLMTLFGFSALAQTNQSTVTISTSPSSGSSFTVGNFNLPYVNVALAVNDDFTPGAIETTGETICSGGTPTEIGSATPASGGDNAITYSWRSSADGYTASISGATGETYTPPAGLTTTTSYRRYANDGTFNPTPTASTGTWTVTVNQPSVAPTSISGTTTICYGSNTTLTAEGGTLGTGANYQWGTGAVVGTNPLVGETASTLTISPSSTTTYWVRIENTTSPCTATTTGVTQAVTVNQPSVAPTSISGTTTICYGSNTTLTAEGGTLGTGANYQWGTGAVVGTNPLVGETASTLTISPSSTTTYWVRIENTTSPCDVNTSGITQEVIVSPLSVGGTVSSNANVCSGSNSGLLTLSGYTGSIVRWEYSVNPFSSWTTIANTTSTYTSGALTETTKFRAVVQSGTCAVNYSSEATITIATATYASGAWDNITGPNATMAAVISDTFTSAGTDITACSLTVNNNATVVISSGNTVTLSGPLVANVGSIVTFNNNANLIQTGTTNNNVGAIQIKRNSAPILRLDYTLWSTPVTSTQTLLDFSPATLTNRFYEYLNATNVFSAVTPSTTIFSSVKAKGFLIRVANNHPAATPTVWTGTFTGVSNNGNYSFALQSGFNLIGNPYPSPVSLAQLVSDNSSSVENTVYFWRKTNNLNQLTSATPNYCTLNIATNAYTLSDPSLPVPNGIIQVGQGFFIEAKASPSPLQFNNGQRVNNHANQFFRANGNNSLSNTTIESNPIWLNITGASNQFFQTVVGYYTNGTLGVDSTDSKYFDGSALVLNSLIDSNQYIIQGRPVPFDPNDVVPLNFKCGEAGNFTIAIDHVGGLFLNGQSIYLRDNVTGTIHDLTAGSYTFASSNGSFTSRFELLYQMPLGTNTPAFNANQIVVFPIGQNELSINTGAIEMKNIKIFNITGQLLNEFKGINSTQKVISLNGTNQVIIIQVESVDGAKVSKKYIR